MWLERSVVVGVISTLVARSRLRATEEPPELLVERTCEVLVAAYLAAEERSGKEENATLLGEEESRVSVLVEEVVGTARVPGTIAATAARALATSALAAWWSPTTSKTAASEVPAWARVERTRGPRYAVRGSLEGLAVRFVRSLLESHDVVRRELSPAEASARIRHLRRTTEALGSFQNLVAPVLVRGRFGLRGGVRVRRDASAAKCVWFEPVGCDASRGTLVYLHGGGFLIGSATTNGEMVARLASAVNLRTLLVEYRKSPESQFPAALVDTLRAVRHVLKENDGHGGHKLVLGGDSAGGTLAFAALLALRRVGVKPACAFLLSPLVDLDATGSGSADDDILPAFEPDGVSDKTIRDFYHPAENNNSGRKRAGGLFFFDNFRLGDPTDGHAALLSPAAAGRRELAKIAETPLCVHVGGKEVLCDSIVQWASKAKAAGATVDLTVFQDEVHVFHAFAFSPAWPRAALDLRTFVARHLDHASPAPPPPRDDGEGVTVAKVSSEDAVLMSARRRFTRRQHTVEQSFVSRRTASGFLARISECWSPM